MATVKQFYYIQKIWTSSLVISGVLGGLLAYKIFPEKQNLFISILVLLFSLMAALLYWMFSVKPKVKSLNILNKYCDNILYWPRKHSFTCKRGRAILCYNYASSMYYIIKINNIYKKNKVNFLTPLDYYCFKMLGGELQKTEGHYIYNGKLETLSEAPYTIIRGEGRVIYSTKADVFNRVDRDDYR